MAKRGRKLTPMQVEYKKQQTRIKNFIRRAEKRGYKFEDNLIPEMPKRVTKKALQEIKDINQYKLYKHATYEYEVSGEVVPAREHIKLARSMAGERGYATRSVKKIMRDYGYDEYTARKKFWDDRREKERRSNDEYARSKGYRDWDDLVWHNEQRERQKEFDADVTSSYIEDTEIEVKPIYVEQEVIVPVERPKPDFHVETPEEKQERLLRELAEVQKEIEEKNATSEPVDIEQEASKHDFWNELKKSLKEKEKDARDRYYSESDYEPEIEHKGETSKSEKVLETIEAEIATWEPATNWTNYFANKKEADKDNLSAMLNNAIESEGRQIVAQRLEEQAEYAMALADQICYGSDQQGTSFAFTEFSSIIMGRKLTMVENAFWTAKAEEGGIYN